MADFITGLKIDVGMYVRRNQCSSLAYELCWVEYLVLANNNNTMILNLLLIVIASPISSVSRKAWHSIVPFFFFPRTELFVNGLACSRDS